MRLRRLKIMLLLLLAAVGWRLCQPLGSGAQTAAPPIDFNRDIRPILSDKCFVCHGPDAAAKKLTRFDSEAAAAKVIVPGKPEQSKLIKRITHADEDLRMPPKDSGRKLTAAEIELLQEWIRQGAKWQTHWAFVAPVRPALPPVKNSAWPKNAIDYFVLARLEKEGLQPSPEANRTTLLRRVSLDLTGLPPTPQEVAAFVNDTSPNAYEKVVDRLLASPRYGERMAFRWLDAARYADTNGYQFDAERQMWRWRDWVIEAFNRNLPYDQFIVEQLAGDLLPNPTTAQRLATGFNRNHRTNSEDGVIPEEYAVEYVIDRVDTTGTVFLGLTVGCARCHNHKYDPLTQQEFYQLYAYFNSIPENGRSVRDGNSPPLMHAPTAEQQHALQALENQLAESEAFLARNEKRIRKAQQTWERALTHDAPHWFPREGLVAHFALDEGNEQFKDGVYQTGAIHRAAVFDGKTVLHAGKVANFDVQDSFALSLWMNPATASGLLLTHAENVGSEIKSPGAQIGKGYGLALKDGKLQFNLVSVWANDAIRVETENPVALNEWQHVLATYDGNYSAAGVRVYVNGQLQTLKVHYDSVFRPIATNQPLLLGGTANPKAPRWQGLLDEVRIYDRVPTTLEIAVLAKAEPPAAMARTTQRNEAQRYQLRAAFLERAAPADIQTAAQRWLELKEQKARLEKTFPRTMVMQELDTPRPAFRLKRGAYDAPAEQVPRALPAALPPLPEGAPNNRLGLARWLVHPSHPLTTRVAVNRFWQMFFGVGLVKTAEDFGAQGEPPSHPELLDWLAVKFRNGTGSDSDLASNAYPLATARGTVPAAWNVKALLKTIVMSATYRQASNRQPTTDHRQPHSDDPENRLLARGPRLRLPAEMIRDQALHAAGLLVEQVGGPSVKPYQPAGLWDDLVIKAEGAPPQVYVQDHGASLYRRTLYTFWKRTIAPPFMLNFDGAGRETCVVREHRTNTPLQALNLMNDVTYVEAARVLAERAMREGGATNETRLRHLFRLTLARLPNAREEKILSANWQAQLTEFRADAAKAARLLQTGEKSLDASLDANELAAYATVASLLFNTDEFVTKE